MFLKHYLYGDFLGSLYLRGIDLNREGVFSRLAGSQGYEANIEILCFISKKSITYAFMLKALSVYSVSICMCIHHSVRKCEYVCYSCD